MAADTLKDSYQKRGQDTYLTPDEVQDLFAFRANKEKYNIESSRYKQDCRKRALDLAHNQVTSRPFNELFEKEKFMKEGVLIYNAIAQDEVLTALADKYYNWLISIPEK